MDFLAAGEYSFKVVEIGDSSVGKTAIKVRFTDDYFKKDLKSMLGIDFGSKVVEVEYMSSDVLLHATKKLRVKLNVWNFGGQKVYEGQRRMYYGQARGALLVFEVTNPASFRSLPDWLKELEENIGDRIPTLLVGNKVDLADEREISREEAVKFAKENGLLYFESSAWTGRACARPSSGWPWRSTSTSSGQRTERAAPFHFSFSFEVKSSRSFFYQGAKESSVNATPSSFPGHFRDWGPYLSFGPDPSTTMVVCWQTSEPLREAWVRWGTAPERLLPRVTRLAHERPTTRHRVRLTGLEPGRTHYYQLSRDGGRTTYSFRTAPPPSSREPFEFAVVGDVHSTHRDVRPGFKAIDRYAPGTAFLLLVGDTIDDGRSDADWNDFFYQVSPFTSDRPWMNATGNHDAGDPVKYQKFLAAWEHPYVDPASGAYYAFQYANAHFVVLDSCNAGGWEPTPSDEQLEWLERELAARARGDQWVFAFLHHQIYSTGDFSCARVMHEYLRPVFDEFRVDAVFYGHDHHFEAFHVGRDEPWGGTHYVVTGGGGSNLDWSIMDPNKRRGNRVTGPHYLWLSEEHVASREFYSGGDAENRYGRRNDELVRECQLYGVLRHHFTHLRVHGARATLRAVGWDGTELFRRQLRLTRKPA